MQDRFFQILVGVLIGISGFGVMWSQVFWFQIRPLSQMLTLEKNRLEQIFQQNQISEKKLLDTLQRLKNPDSQRDWIEQFARESLGMIQLGETFIDENFIEQ